MEPGANPGRAGHCEGGALFIKSLATAEKTKRREDAKSGYLLCGNASGKGLYSEVLEISAQNACFCADIFIL